MKKIIILVSLFLISIQVFGQEVINLNIDSLVFNKRIGNTFLSESSGASINCTIMPMNYDQMLPGIQHESNPQAEVVEQLETLLDDKRLYTKKGRIVMKSDTILVEAYLIEVSSEKSLLITGNYSISKKDIILDMIEKSAKSAMIIE